MKKIYINENQITKDLLLPKFLFDAVRNHETSLGDNPAFPGEDDYPFDYTILKENFRNVYRKMHELGLPTDANTDELTTLLGRMVRQCKEMEEPIKDSLEKICENTVNRIFAIPEGAVNILCKLVDKVEYEVSASVTPEISTDKKFRFKDIGDFELSKAAIAKRRFINALIMGGCNWLTTGFHGFYNLEIKKLNPELVPLYEKIMALNEYLLFVTEEEMDDNHPKQGSYVEVYVGGNGKKSTIKSQGVIFPLLLHDTIKGLFELFSVHGLPDDREKREYIMKKADFLLAEPWDMRLGTPLWAKIFGTKIEDDNLLPYMFMYLVKLPCEEFNATMKELLIGSEKGTEIFGQLMQAAQRNDGYQKFQKRINARNVKKSVIADSYFTAAELDGFDIDGEESEDVIEEHQDGFVEYYGIFLDDSSKEKLRSLAPQNAYRIYCDHMTLAHSSKFTDDVVETCRVLLGKQFTLTATTIGVSDDAVAVGIETDCFSMNPHKHITICTLTPDSKPVQSNYIEKWYRLREPIILNGTVMGFTSNGLVTEGINESIENQDSPLYHYTFLGFLDEILETGKFETSSRDIDYDRAEKYDDGWAISSNRNRPYISFTRDKGYNVNLDKKSYGKIGDVGSQVRIKFSPKFFKGLRHATLRPYDYNHFNSSMYSYPDQKEEKLFFNKPVESIPFDGSCIEKVDILTWKQRFDKDIPFLERLQQFPDVVRKTNVYFIDNTIYQSMIDKTSGEVLKDKKYNLYSKFLIGDEKYAIPLTDLLNKKE